MYVCVMLECESSKQRMIARWAHVWDSLDYHSYHCYACHMNLLSMCVRVCVQRNSLVLQRSADYPGQVFVCYHPTWMGSFKGLKVCVCVCVSCVWSACVEQHSVQLHQAGINLEVTMQSVPLNRIEWNGMREREQWSCVMNTRANLPIWALCSHDAIRHKAYLNCSVVLIVSSVSVN